MLDFVKRMDDIFSFKEMRQFFGRGGLELSHTMKASGNMTAFGNHASIRREMTHHSMRWMTTNSLPRRTITCTIEGPERSLDGGTMGNIRIGRMEASS